MLRKNLRRKISFCPLIQLTNKLLHSVTLYYFVDHLTIEHKLTTKFYYHYSSDTEQQNTSLHMSWKLILTCAKRGLTPTVKLKDNAVLVRFRRPRNCGCKEKAVTLVRLFGPRWDTKTIWNWNELKIGWQQCSICQALTSFCTRSVAYLLDTLTH